MLGASIAEYVPTEYADYQFEPWVEGVGFFMVALPIVSIIGVAILKAIQLGVSSWGLLF